MVDGSALFVENVYKPYFRSDASEAQFLFVGRIVGVIIVISGLAVTLLSTSVVEVLVLAWSLSAFFGIAVWGGIIWRRCNTYGAWAGILVSIAL